MPRGQETKGRDWDLTRTLSQPSGLAEQAGRGGLHLWALGSETPAP